MAQEYLKVKESQAKTLGFALEYLQIIFDFYQTNKQSEFDVTHVTKFLQDNKKLS